MVPALDLSCLTVKTNVIVLECKLQFLKIDRENPVVFLTQRKLHLLRQWIFLLLICSRKSMFAFPEQDSLHYFSYLDFSWKQRVSLDLCEEIF